MEIDEIEKRLKEFERKLKPVTADKLKALKEKTENAKHYADMNASEVMELEEKKDIQGLVKVVERSKNKNVVKHAIIALGEMKDNRAVEPLIYALNSNLVTIRHYSVMALGHIGNAKAVKPLVTIIHKEDEYENVRESAVEALGKIATEEAIDNLVAILGTSLSDKALKVLKVVGKPAVEPLISAVKARDTDYTIRCWSATALGDIGDMRAVEVLLDLLNDAGGALTMRLKGHAAEALGKIGDNRAVEPLIKLLEDQREQHFARHCAAWALLQFDNDRAALPLIKYFKKNLDALKNWKPLQYDVI
jgi:HEAT repeat protein